MEGERRKCLEQIRFTEDFLSETMQVRRKWSEILKVLKEKKSRILVKASFKSEGE